MKVLGIRVYGINCCFAIYDSEKKEIITEEIFAPLILEMPERLKYLRFSIIDILKQYNIEYAGIKIIEYGSFKQETMNRLYIEGVIQETFATSNLKEYYLHRKNFLNSCIDSKEIKIDNLIKDSNEFNLFVNKYVQNTFKITKKELREVSLIAICSHIKALK